MQGLVQDVLGVQTFDGRYGGGHTVNMPPESYAAVENAMDAVVERVVQLVDWPRLLEEAGWRHQFVHEDKDVEENLNTNVRGVCSECLREALLVSDTEAQCWTQELIPLEHQMTDWPSSVHDNFQHRSASHPYVPGFHGPNGLSA